MVEARVQGEEAIRDPSSRQGYSEKVLGEYQLFARKRACGVIPER